MASDQLVKVQNSSANIWSIVYESAIRKDGSLLFPERLTKTFLEEQRLSMGSYLFANQYLNEILPDSERRFKPEWLRKWKNLPENRHTFAFIDPAIGQDKHHDYTGVVVVDVDHQGVWYVRTANRYRLTPTEIVAKCFEIQDQYKTMGIGVEAVAYQEALLYLLAEEMRRRQKTLPIKGIKRASVSKETRILGLVPRFEWGRVLLAQGLTDLEDELLSFPRGAHDDLSDALASIEDIVVYPTAKIKVLEKPPSQSHPDYEKWYIQNLGKGADNG